MGKVLRTADSLEDLCTLAYHKYLETEIVTYITLTQSRSQLCRGVTRRMLAILKDDINSKLTGVASSVLREKMVGTILSDKFPSTENYIIYFPQDKKVTGEGERIVRG